MTQESPERSPLARLVLFIIFLSLAGTFVAGLHWYTIDLPRQELINAPENSFDSCEEKCGLFTKCVVYKTGSWDEFCCYEAQHFCWRLTDDCSFFW